MTIETIAKRISKKLNIDYEKVLKVCKFQFAFIEDTIKDPDDYHNVLLNNLFSFKLKSKYKENKQLSKNKQYGKDNGSGKQHSISD